MGALFLLHCGVLHAEGEQCKIVDRSALVVVVVCPQETSRDALRETGMRACKGQNPCNAWIWTDDASAPVKAPATDKELPKPATSAARAVWINDAQQLLEIRRAR